MELFDRCDGLGEKNLRALDDPIPLLAGFQVGERFLVNPGDVQRLQPVANGLATEFPR